MCYVVINAAGVRFCKVKVPLVSSLIVHFSARADAGCCGAYSGSKPQT